MIEIKYKLLHPMAVEPIRASVDAACFDLYNIHETRIVPGETFLVATGIAIEIPKGHVGLLMLRSSLAIQGFRLSNGVGVIDADYRGEIKVALSVLKTANMIYSFNRIAQMMIVELPKYKLISAIELSPTERGEGGFGSTGK